MSITLPKISYWFYQKSFVLLLLIFPIFTNFVHCARQSASAESSEVIGPTAAASSLVPTSTGHHHQRGDRERISAQFRAAKDGRNLDATEGPISMAGLDTLSAAAAAAALEDDPVMMSKYMAASASAYPPSKIARLNKFNQAGFYDPYPTYAAAPLNSVPSSYYPYNAYASYRDTNPMLDTYPYYERDRIRELKERAMQASQSAPFSSGSSSSSSSNRDGYSGGGNFFGGFREGFRSAGDHDSTAMSSSHGHGHDEGGGGGGGGNGWGWGHYTSKVNTNAIGLLGLMGLLSLLSNVLLLFTTTTTTTTAAAGRRRKRSPFGGEEDDVSESRDQRRERIFMEILPHLTPVAHARDGVIPPECTFRGVCMANKVLVDEFGVVGRAGGMRISSAIVKLLEKVSSQNATDDKISTRKPSDKASKYSYTRKKSSDIRKNVENAGMDGRNKKDCQKNYPVCNELQSQILPDFPFAITMHDLPHLISKVNKMVHHQHRGEERQIHMKL